MNTRVVKKNAGYLLLMPDMVYSSSLLQQSGWKIVPFSRSISYIFASCLIALSSAQALSPLVAGAPVGCPNVRYIVINQQIGTALSDMSHACGFTAMVGEGLNQQARAGEYAGDLNALLLDLNKQQPLHWGRINNTLYADDAARSGSANIDLKAMSRSAFEQLLTNNRITVNAAQVTHDAGTNIYRIAGPVSFVTDLEQTLSSIRSRAVVSTDTPVATFQNIRVIKFGVISNAAN